MKILQKMKIAILGVAAMCVLGLGCVANPAYAECSADCTTGCANSAEQATCYANLANGGETTSLMSTLQQIINVVLGVLGFVAVAVLVYGGVQYTISAGDAGKVKKAKDTILYGIIGLVVALLAAAIVNFVLAGVFASSSTTTSTTTTVVKPGSSTGTSAGGATPAVK